MMINHNYNNLNDSYLFSDIARRIAEHKEKNPDSEIIRLGIGDVTLPLVPPVVSAMNRAVEEMGSSGSFRGYGEEQGYGFLRRAVCGYYTDKRVDLDETEVFISDGAKSDLANILDLFSSDNTVLIPDPVYPVYVDTNIMAGRRIMYAKGSRENGFLPLPEQNVKADIIYLCSPNNPTGAVYSREELKRWVDYALENKAVILFDSAYEIFIQDKSLPTSIYQVEGAKQCAIEFCSLSKTAGFTGTRCGYTVVPHELVRDGSKLNRMWLRRQTTKFNGVPYIVQRGAEAVFTDEGMRDILKNISYYLENVRILSETLDDIGIRYTGGRNAPYIWLECPSGMTSWTLFDKLLNEVGIVGTPGAGFGQAGEGYFRLTAFGSRDDFIKASSLLKETL